MHLLLVTEKYCAGNAIFGLSNHSHNLFGSLESTNLATFDNLYLDQCEINKAIIEYFQTIRLLPNSVVFGYLGHSNLNPSLETIKLLHHNNIPLVFIFPDTVYDWANDIINSVRPYAKLVVCFDTPGIDRPSNVISTIVPQDPRLYYPREKTIDVNFLGSVYGKRSEYLNYLVRNKLNITIMGGQHNLPKLTPAQYAAIIGQSKISINFPWSAAHNSPLQVKGRVFEILASNSLLLELEDSPTQKYLNPGEDYIEYRDEADLLDIIYYYLEHDEERQKISSNGYRKYMENYTARHFWKQVLG